jgi:BirA family transcriptional regulator, biotin operon repressor / biotin---[acetyl-CoA-carboxylase] ligase
MTLSPTYKQPTDSRRRKLLSLLADGQFYSGEELARQLKVTRSAVWKLIGKLRASGIEIEALPRQGYRLPYAVELYDSEAITAMLGDSSRSVLSRIDTLLSVDSTNRHLIDTPATTPGESAVCVAELQTAGRGRRGRAWMAPFGAGISLSLTWQFAEAPPTISALSLVVGLAAVRALRRFGAAIELKWPNDLFWSQRKLGGVLIEMRGEMGGPARVVIGLGLNMLLPAATRIALAEQQAALVSDVHEILQARTPGRNTVSAALIDELIAVLKQFEREGFAAFHDEWQQSDALNNRAIRVLFGSQTINGIARGVAPDGALQVEVDGQVRRFMSGDVSVRAAG